MEHLPTTIGTILSIAIFIIGFIINIIYFKNHRKKANAVERFIARSFIIVITALAVLLISASFYNMF